MLAGVVPAVGMARARRAVRGVGGGHGVLVCCVVCLVGCVGVGHSREPLFFLRNRKIVVGKCKT